MRFDLAQVLHGDGRHGARQLTLAADVQAPERAEAIRSRGLELVGWVANSAEEPMNKLEENIEAIDARIKAPRLAHVPFLIDVSVQTALRYFDI